MNLIIHIIEYSQQLPIDGGVYFHPDLMESSKLIYKEHWVVIMHAFSIWIKNSSPADVEIENKVDEIDESNESSEKNKKSNKENNLLYTILGDYFNFLIKKKTSIQVSL
jgi:hypothetical protein